jgi:hypothetical protein
MGYYTQYTIKISGADNANQMVKIAQDLELGNDYEVSNCGSALLTCFEEKWYGWKEDFERVSRTYPRVLFEVNGIGEDKDDQWRARIRNGESEVIRARIVFDEFQKIK